MIPLGALGQIYFLCATVGIGFLAISFLMGHLGHTSDHSGIGHGFDGYGSGTTGNLHLGGLDHSGATGHHLDALGQGGAGHHFGSTGSAQSSDHGTNLHGGTGSGGAGTGNKIMGPLPVVIPLQSRITSTIGGTIISFLSPMSLAITLTFFGLVGLTLGYITPWLGLLTIVPAIISGLVASAAFKLLVRWMIRNMEVNTVAKINELVGQVAEVNIPIHDGRLGEVTYIVGSKRYNAAAQPAKLGMSFKRGAKVMIVEVKDHVVSVEPVTDFLLDSNEVEHGS